MGYYFAEDISPEESVKEWYGRNFPTDDLGNELYNINFDEVYRRMQDGEEFYNIVGVADSIIRERIFQAMTDLFSPTGDYDDIYNLWLR